MTKRVGLTGIFLAVAGLVSVQAAELPKTIAYYGTPSAYFDEHADDVAQLYDGFFFNVGSWDEGVVANLGLSRESSPTTDWKEKIGRNLAHLRSAGVTENLLSVSFSDSAPWPSPETLLSAEYTAKMAKHFGSLGRNARELGFRGVSIDVEYPYPRYSLDHAVYTYDGYTAEDLLAAAGGQGRAVMDAVLDAFPDAVIFELPGYLLGRPIERAFTIGMLDVMAERDAPGGFHLGTERAYCLLDPVSQVAISREGDLTACALLTGKTLDYWKRRCTVAPGVWPLHMVETGGKGYPVRPWREELAELRQQMEILRGVAKRYMWSFSGQPVWYPYSEDLVRQYGLPKQEFNGAAEAVAGWHEILRDKKVTEDTRILKLVRDVKAFDRGKIGPAELCSRFGTPGDWLVLSPLGNPFTQPAFAASRLPLGPIRFDAPVNGRDGLVRWHTFHNYEPLGSVRLMAAAGWRRTDDCSALLASNVSSARDVKAFLWLNWDDGVVVRLNGQTVFDHPDYPERGHGLLYNDRYNFEDHVPVEIPKGESLLLVTSINLHGSWGVNLRIADQDGFPLDGVSFSLPRHVD